MPADGAGHSAPAPQRRIWRVLLRWFRAPEAPPELPGGSPDETEVFLPAAGYLSYLRWEALVTGVLVAAGFGLAGLVLALAGKGVGGWFALSAALAFLLGGALVALLSRLRWLMMWYALGERALRARYGLWTIHELTITYENVQNIEVNQGPLMRLFGIWRLDIQTAGGASRAVGGGGNPLLTVLLVAIQIVASFAPGGAALGGVFSGSRSRASKQAPRATGSIYGLVDPLPVRDRIMARVRASRSAGLGDEAPDHRRAAEWARRTVTQEHVEVLRSIRDRLARGGAA